MAILRYMIGGKRKQIGHGHYSCEIPAEWRQPSLQSPLPDVRMEVPHISPPDGQSPNVGGHYRRYVCHSWVERGYEVTSESFVAGYYSSQAPLRFNQTRFPARPLPRRGAGP
jgi:hypothetical protein